MADEGCGRPERRRGPKPSPPDVSFEGILIGWDDVAGMADGAGTELVGRRLEALVRVGVDLVVVTTSSIEALDQDLSARPEGPGRLWAVAGPRQDRYEMTATGAAPMAPDSLADSAEGNRARDQLLGSLRSRGLGERLVLVLGRVRAGSGWSSATIWLPGDADGLLAVLDDQLDRRLQGRVPGRDDDPSWAIQVGDDAGARAHDALLCLADGRFGTRGEGSSPTPTSGSSPMLLAAGVYHDQSQAHLLEGPLWNQLDLDDPDVTGQLRVLNLRSGVLSSVQPCAVGPVTSVWFNSLTLEGVMAMRAEGPPGAVRPGPAVGPPATRRGSHLRWRRTGSSILVDGDGPVRRWDRRGRVAASGLCRDHGLGRDARTARCLCLRRLRAGPPGVGVRRPGRGREGRVRRVVGPTSPRLGGDLVGCGDLDRGRPGTGVGGAIRGVPPALLRGGEGRVGGRGTRVERSELWRVTCSGTPMSSSCRPWPPPVPPRPGPCSSTDCRRLEPAAGAWPPPGDCAGARFPWESGRDGDDVTPAVVPRPRWRADPDSHRRA